MSGAVSDHRIRQRLAGTLPDTPRWLEARGMLLSGRGRLVGWSQDAQEWGVFDDSVVPLLAFVGAPEARVVVDALTTLRPAAVLIQEADDRSLSRHLRGWKRERAFLHRLAEGVVLEQSTADAPCRLLVPGEPRTWLRAWPQRERRELAAALDLGLPMAATVTGGEVASVCYAAYETESLWDVSIDTLERYRRRGLAAAAVRCLAAHLAARGLQPAWGAVESNAASFALAARLGFRPAESVLVYEPVG
jgi:RimJ/RimL family protein N-acetyltransferase